MENFIIDDCSPQGFHVYNQKRNILKKKKFYRNYWFFNYIARDRRYLGIKHNFFLFLHGYPLEVPGEREVLLMTGFNFQTAPYYFSSFKNIHILFF